MGFLFDDFSGAFLKKAKKILDQVNSLEGKYKGLSQEQTKEEFSRWKTELQEGKIQLKDIVPEVFAAVREALVRTIGKRPFDVQILGGLAIYEGNIAEMKTGEGKTLVATLPAALRALLGKGVHVVTVNDYLAKRDAQIVTPAMESLGLSVGYVIDNSTPEEKKQAYACDITYTSNNQVAFDYLRDNMVTKLEDKVIQKGLEFAIIDEIDNILIDEAKTPLIISDQKREDNRIYNSLNEVIESLEEYKDYKIEHKSKNAYFTKEGSLVVEEFLHEKQIISGGLFEEENLYVYHVICNLLKAHKGMLRDRDYIVHNNEIIIIDEYTGRLSFGRRYSSGLHQAIEAKEGVPIKDGSVTKALTSYTNFFRNYANLGGMTGTASPDREEFEEIYNLKIVQIPTNRPVIRKDNPQINLYRIKEYLYEDVVQLIVERHKKFQPVLICTSSVKESEIISSMLADLSLDHKVLNAKSHEQEAQIVAQAGRPGSIVVSTNMAGRGTDISLGGSVDMVVDQYMKDNPDLDREEITAEITADWKKDREIVLKAGGLLVIIVGAQDSKKAEIQFRGRAGRQGEPGESIIFYSLQDDILVPLFNDAINRVMINHYFPLEKRCHLTQKANDVVRQVQETYSAHYFELRKNQLKYDEVVNEQRKATYSFRDYLMGSPSIKKSLVKIKDLWVKDMKMKYPQDPAKLREALFTALDITEENRETFEAVDSKFLEALEIEQDEDLLSSALLRRFDEEWYENIIELDNLKKTIHLVSYEQKDPSQEYRNSCYKLYEEMLRRFREGAVSMVMHRSYSPMQNIDFLSGNLPDLNYEDMDFETLMNEFSKNSFAKLFADTKFEDKDDEDTDNEDTTDEEDEDSDEALDSEFLKALERFSRSEGLFNTGAAKAAKAKREGRLAISGRKTPKKTEKSKNSKEFQKKTQEENILIDHKKKSDVLQKNLNEALAKLSKISKKLNPEKVKSENSFQDEKSGKNLPKNSSFSKKPSESSGRASLKKPSIGASLKEPSMGDFSKKSSSGEKNLKVKSEEFLKAVFKKEEEMKQELQNSKKISRREKSPNLLKDFSEKKLSGEENSAQQSLKKKLPKDHSKSLEDPNPPKKESTREFLKEIKPATEKVQTIGQKTSEFLKKEEILPSVKKAGQKVSNFVKEEAEEIKEKISPFIKKAGQKVSNFVKEEIEEIKEKISPPLKRAGEKVSEFLKEKTEEIKEKISPSVKKARQKVSNFVKEELEEIKEKISPSVKKAEKKVSEFLQEKIEEVKPEIEKARKMGAEFLQEKAEEIKEKISPPVKKAGEKASEFPQERKQEVKEKIKSAQAIVKKASEFLQEEEIKEKISPSVKKVEEEVSKSLPAEKPVEEVSKKNGKFQKSEQQNSPSEKELTVSEKIKETVTEKVQELEKKARKLLKKYDSEVPGLNIEITEDENQTPTEEVSSKKPSDKK